MIGDFFLSILTFIIRAMVNTLPVSFPFMGIVEYRALLNELNAFLSGLFSFISPFFNVSLLLSFINFALLGIVVVFTFLIIKFLINVIRGSGA